MRTRRASQIFGIFKRKYFMDDPLSYRVNISYKENNILNYEEILILEFARNCWPPSEKNRE